MKAFARHYLEMVVAMFGGMVAFQMSRRLWASVSSAGDDGIRSPLGPVSTGNSWGDVGAIAGMDLAMVVPMVLWMRFRGHSWRHGAEMSAAMIAPTVPVYAAGFAWPDLPLVSLWSHVAMLLGVLALMVAQRDTYLGHAHGHGGHDHPADPGATTMH